MRSLVSVSALSVIFSFSALGLSGPLDSYTRMVDRVTGSIVRIEGTDKEGGGHVCTGEVIGVVNHVDRVLTAGHCTGETMTADGHPATILKSDDYYDLLLLSVPDLDKPVVSMRDLSVVRYEDLTAIGYAFGFDQVIALNVRAVLVDYAPTKQMAPGLLVQFEYVRGMSGGPVVDHNGQMVGIVQQGNSGIGYGVSTVLIRAFLLGS